MNLLIIALTALVPLIIGFIWYNPKVMGNAWMEASGLDEEKMKGANMALIFGVTYVFSLMLAASMATLTIHQMSVGSLLANETDPKVMADLMAKYGTEFRSFKHGALHGALSALFIGLPLLGIPALFERKGFKYIAINVGFWVIAMTIMGGIICQFLKLG